jgi:pyruvate-formate lyase-activating enzyme
MGCLNSKGSFSHWFANIHLSGPCNRSCYWCIGQHMMALDGENNLDTYPLKNFDKFVKACTDRSIGEVNLTGTNTDPLMYKHLPRLTQALREAIPGVKLGLRTNGALALKNMDEVRLFDKISFSIHSHDPVVYRKIMGQGTPPFLFDIMPKLSDKAVKINMVLCPENMKDDGWLESMLSFIGDGVKTINLREPYGQPHIGNPMESELAKKLGFERLADFLGMPQYEVGGAKVTYWDVHYVHVESVNLYANGNISEDYPVTRGHDVTGDVKDQSNFTGGRVRDQWITLKKKNENPLPHQV